MSTDLAVVLFSAVLALEIASEPAAVEYEDRQQIMAIHSPAVPEAVAAFPEKRPASFAD
jgi:hypothetical protein